MRDVDADTVNLSASFDVTDNFIVYVQGDHVLTTDTCADRDDRAGAWSMYTGFGYILPSGVILETGWKHEEVKWKQNYGVDAHGAWVRNNTRTQTLDGKADIIYGRIGFEF